LSFNASAQRIIEEKYKIELHLEMASKFQIASGSLILTSLVAFGAGYFLTKGDTQKMFYIVAADCVFMSAACQIGAGYHLRINRKE